MNLNINLCGDIQHLLNVPAKLDSPVFTFALMALAAIFLIGAGIKNKASIGIFLTVGLIVIAARLKQTSFAQMGFVLPENWLITVPLGLLIGSVLALLSITVIQPLIESLTRQPHDISIVNSVRGSWKGLISWLALNWTIVAFGEEVLYRGFLMSQLIKLLGTGILALALNVLFSSTVFGISHWYQSRSGAWSTGIIGICLGVIYILSGYNLWLPILVHGMGNTVEFILISVGYDKKLRVLFWKRPVQMAG